MPAPNLTTRLADSAAQRDRMAMGAIFEHAFGEPYGAAAVADLLKPEAAWAAIAEIDGDGPVGFAIAASAADESELYTIAVPPRFQRQGIGAALLRAVAETCVLKGARSLFLEVAEDNHTAHALYRRTGFHEIGRRKAYYRRAEGMRTDALILKKVLAPSDKISKGEA